MLIPLYWTGILNPAKGTILAPSSIWISFNATLFIILEVLLMCQK
jgi:hypothetical protein